MSYSEKAFLRIRQIAAEQETDIVEAAALFCEEHDLDAGDFVRMCDKNIVEHLRVAAVDARKVRRCVAAAGNQINF